MQGSQRILVVDDDLLVRQIVVQALRRSAPYHVDEASNAAEAIALHSADPYDLVVSDIRMEHMESGVDVLRGVKERSPDTSVILLTAHASLGTAIAAVREGADNYLLKPVSVAELTASVMHALKRRSAALAQRAALEQIASSLRSLAQAVPPAASVGDRPAEATSTERFLTSGALQIDTHQYTAIVGDIPVELTPTEFAIVHALMRSAGRTLTFEQLVTHTHGHVVDREEARLLLASHVRNLRRKLATTADRIVNVRGVGYYLTQE
jgi:DNA-binding response OmpR family regulator